VCGAGAAVAMAGHLVIVNGRASGLPPLRPRPPDGTILPCAAGHGGWLADGWARAPGKIVCVGRNYREHADELGHTLTPEPLLFLKPPSAVIGMARPSSCPACPRPLRIDYEGELVAIIGRPSGTPRRGRPGGVGGYTCGNDVTARDIQAAEEQWTRPRVRHLLRPRTASCQLGPLGCRDHHPGQWRGPPAGPHPGDGGGVGELLAYISRCMTLEPATPSSPGHRRGRSLHDGDVVEVEIEGIGCSATRSSARAEGPICQLSATGPTVYRCDHREPTSRRMA